MPSQDNANVNDSAMHEFRELVDIDRFWGEAPVEAEGVADLVGDVVAVGVLEAVDVAVLLLALVVCGFGSSLSPCRYSAKL